MPIKTFFNRVKYKISYLTFDIYTPPHSHTFRCRKRFLQHPTHRIQYWHVKTVCSLKKPFISDPSNASKTTTVIASAQSSNQTTQNNIDPGGGCRKCDLGSTIGTIYCLSHYFSLVIAMLFFVEVSQWWLCTIYFFYIILRLQLKIIFLETFRVEGYT